MGNCCFPSGQMMTLVNENGNIYEQLVCTRCHRPNHSRKECYASTYSDGSLIKQICRKCGLSHNNGWNNCHRYDD